MGGSSPHFPHPLSTREGDVSEDITEPSFSKGLNVSLNLGAITKKLHKSAQTL